MYIPEHFLMKNLEVIHQIIQAAPVRQVTESTQGPDTAARSRKAPPGQRLATP